MTGISPKSKSRNLVQPWTLGVACAPLLVAMWAALIYAPEESAMGTVQRIFYFHVPSAWTAFLAFGVVFAAGIAYLRTRWMVWDVIARCSAEIGLLFTTLALITGAIWAKPVWGTWWTWEPRLTTTLVLWLIYAGYLLIRSAIPHAEQRATFASVAGVIGFIDVPIVFGSIHWWRTVHPVVLTGGGFEMARPMLIALLVSLAAFTILFAVLLRLRVSIEESRGEAEILAQASRWYNEQEV